MSEQSTLTGPLLKAYEQAGALAFRMQSGRVKVVGGWMYLCKAGTADILVFPRTGLVTWVETKTPTGTTKRDRVEAQGRFRDEVVAMGHRYIRATTIDEGLAALR